jgi:hypothetical protein
MAVGLQDDPRNPWSYRQGTTAATLLILTWPALLIRLYVRKFVVNKIGIDDILMVGAQVTRLSSYLWSWSLYVSDLGYLFGFLRS